jgi:SsrA-binding protein
MKITNKKAKFNYKVLEKHEAGIVLTGNEVKAIRNGQVDLSQAYAKIVDNEMYLINANISTNRTRKLLLHKDQIISIQSKIKAKKLTLVPLSLYNKGALIKVELALAKAKRKFEKKEAIKRKEIEREIEKEFKN